jgi:hypothetical protein
MNTLPPWQQQLIVDIETCGFKPGEMVIMTAGRGMGKSMLTKAYVDRMMQDIMSRPIEDIVLSEGRVYGARYYCVEPVGGNWREMEDWCIETYGASTGSIWAQEVDRATPLQCERWYANNRKFWFRTEKDRDWFILRWRS